MKKVIIALIFLGLLGGAYGYYQYSKPSSDVGNKKVQVEIEAAQLVAAFDNNESDANAKYLNKVILVSGTVKNVVEGKGTISIVLDSGNLMSSVTCEFDQIKSDVKLGDHISVKGQCAGYLLDVVMTKCVIQK